MFQFLACVNFFHPQHSEQRAPWLQYTFMENCFLKIVLKLFLWFCLIALSSDLEAVHVQPVPVPCLHATPDFMDTFILALAVSF